MNTMSLLPTPNSMPIALNGNIFSENEWQHKYHNIQLQQQQQQLFQQHYLLVNPDRSLCQNYYLVYVPLIGLPSTLAQHIISTMSTSNILQATSLLNSLLSATTLFSPSFVSNSCSSTNGPPTSSSSSSSMVSLIRQQYRYNLSNNYRYV